MAEISNGYVVSDLPDLTGVALANLLDVSLREECAAFVASAQLSQHQDQVRMWEQPPSSSGR